MCRALVIAEIEKTFAELRARIQTTLDHLKTIDAGAVDAAAEREIVFPIGPTRKVKMQGANYLLHFAWPNFYFLDPTTGYDILRGSRQVQIRQLLLLLVAPGHVTSLTETPTVSITRLHPGPRMSEAVVHGGTIYLAGQVAGQAKEERRRETDVLAGTTGCSRRPAPTRRATPLGQRSTFPNTATFADERRYGRRAPAAYACPCDRQRSSPPRPMR